MKNISTIFILSVIAIMHPGHANEYADIMELTQYRDSLQQAIKDIDAEIAKCEKSTKGWKAATIIGGIGAAASGIGIIVQQKQIKENEKELQKVSKQAKEANAIKNIYTGDK